jgi:hypothetical protein
LAKLLIYAIGIGLGNLPPSLVDEFEFVLHDGIWNTPRCFGGEKGQSERIKCLSR